MNSKEVHAGTLTTAASALCPPSTTVDGVPLGDALVGNNYAYSVLTGPSSDFTNVHRCEDSIWVNAAWAYKLIISGTTPLVSDEVSLRTLESFKDGRIPFDDPQLLETLTTVIHGRWLATQTPVAPVPAAGSRRAWLSSRASRSRWQANRRTNR